MKILVIGESCTDRFIYSRADRLSPEAPVPVLNPIRIDENPGMAGNTKANCEAISNKAQVDLWTQPNKITKTRFVEAKSNHMFIRYDEGEQSIANFNYDLNQIKDYDVVIVSDYDKGFLSDIDIKNISEHAKLSIIDTKRALNNSIAGKYTFIKLNEGEYKRNTELEHYGIIATLGSKGAMWQDTVFPSPRPQETIDVSGAGDTFTAAFIIEYFKSNDVAHSIAFANKMAADVVSRRGVVTPL